MNSDDIIRVIGDSRWGMTKTFSKTPWPGPTPLGAKQSSR
jgi:hypothetical protein